jgi:putative aminopeptidase FrvX
MVLNENKFCRAIDNRMGGFMIAEGGAAWKQSKLPLTIFITNSVQEEEFTRCWNDYKLSNQM